MRLATSEGRLLLAAILALLLAAAVPAATEGKGAIKGTVTSNSKAPVTGAKVIAFNLDTGDVSEAKSDAHGKYVLEGLPQGDYELTAVAEGYDIFGSDEIRVSDGKSVQYDIELIELFQHDPSAASAP